MSRTSPTRRRRRSRRTSTRTSSRSGTGRRGAGPQQRIRIPQNKVRLRVGRLEGREREMEERFLVFVLKINHTIYN